MTKPNDGGPAAEKSLRAWLAGKAISVVRPVYEVTSEPHKPEDGQLPPFSKIRAAVIAREACEVADALIAELEKKVEVQLPEGGEFKFQLGDKVRLRKGDLGWSWSEGVVRERSWTCELGLTYELAVLTVDGKPGSVWMPEDKLEAVEDDGPKFAAPKFKVGDRVWVKPGSMGKFSSVVAVVESFAQDLKGWCYKVSIPMCDKDDRVYDFYYEICLESQEERAGEE